MNFLINKRLCGLNQEKIYNEKYNIIFFEDKIPLLNSEKENIFIFGSIENIQYIKKKESHLSILIMT